MVFSKLSPKQKKVFRWCYAPDSYALICDGSVRSGKTAAMSCSFILWAMKCFNGENFGICTGCKNVDEATNFLKWFMSAEEEAKWAVQAGKLPIRSDAEPVYDYEEEGFQMFLDEMNYALARGPHAEWPSISEQIYTAAQKVFLNGEAAADALAAANEVIAPILEANPLPEQ